MNNITTKCHSILISRCDSFPGARLLLVIALLVMAFGPTPAQTAITNLWTLTQPGRSDSSPAIGADGTIYFGTFRGLLWAVKPDGEVAWRFKAGSEVRSSPAVDSNGTIYFGSRDRRLYALTPDGKKRWEFSTGWWVDASPAIATDGTIFVGSWDRKFYAVAPDGGKKWEFSTDGPIVSSAAIDTNGTIYFGSHDGRLYALSPTGEKLWEYPTGGPILSSPALDWEGNVYFTSVDGGLYRVTRDGQQRWRVATGSIGESSPVLGETNTLFIAGDAAMWRVTAEGQSHGIPFEVERFDAAPVVSAKGEVVFLFRFGQAIGYSYDLAFQWRQVVLPGGFGSPSIANDGMIYVTGLVNSLVAIDYGSPLATTAWPKFRGNIRNTGNLADNPR